MKANERKVDTLSNEGSNGIIRRRGRVGRKEGFDMNGYVRVGRVNRVGGICNDNSVAIGVDKVRKRREDIIEVRRIEETSADRNGIVEATVDFGNAEERDATGTGFSREDFGSIRSAITKQRMGFARKSCDDQFPERTIRKESEGDRIDDFGEEKIFPNMQPTEELTFDSDTRPHSFSETVNVDNALKRGDLLMQGIPNKLRKGLSSSQENPQTTHIHV